MNYLSPEPTYWPKYDPHLTIKVSRPMAGAKVKWIYWCDHPLHRFGSGAQSIAEIFDAVNKITAARFPTAKLSTKCAPEQLEEWFAALPPCPQHVEPAVDVIWARGDLA